MATVIAMTIKTARRDWQERIVYRPEGDADHPWAIEILRADGSWEELDTYPSREDAITWVEYE